MRAEEWVSASKGFMSQEEAQALCAAFDQEGLSAVRRLKVGAVRFAVADPAAEFEDVKIVEGDPYT